MTKPPSPKSSSAKALQAPDPMRLELAPNMSVMIRKDVLGKGYLLDPISGFDGMNPFGGISYKNIVAAKHDAPRVALEWSARQLATPETAGQFGHLKHVVEQQDRETLNNAEGDVALPTKVYPFEKELLEAGFELDEEQSTDSCREYNRYPDGFGITNQDRNERIYVENFVDDKGNFLPTQRMAGAIIHLDFSNSAERYYEKHFQFKLAHTVDPLIKLMEEDRLVAPKRPEPSASASAEDVSLGHRPLSDFDEVYGILKASVERHPDHVSDDDLEYMNTPEGLVQVAALVLDRIAEDWEPSPELSVTGPKRRFAAIVGFQGPSSMSEGQVQVIINSSEKALQYELREALLSGQQWAFVGTVGEDFEAKAQALLDQMDVINHVSEDVSDREPVTFEEAYDALVELVTPIPWTPEDKDSRSTFLTYCS